MYGRSLASAALASSPLYWWRKRLREDRRARFNSNERGPSSFERKHKPHRAKDAAAKTAPASIGPIDLNIAFQEQLEALRGVGRLPP